MDARACGPTGNGTRSRSARGIPHKLDVALLHLTRSAAEIATMRAVNPAFDPDDLLNPGVLFAP
jgi:FAD-dependent oxidoreductase family protein